MKGARRGTEDTSVGHTSHVLSMAITTDSEYLVSTQDAKYSLFCMEQKFYTVSFVLLKASGDSSNFIYIWKPATMERLGILRGHRNAVSVSNKNHSTSFCFSYTWHSNVFSSNQGLAFRKGSHQLFSASHDKLVKIWSVDDLAYVETLYVNTIVLNRSMECYLKYSV